MDSFFQQVFNLLTTETGSLVHHLVLAIAIAGALQAAFLHWRSTGFPQGRRMVIGLSLLLVFRLTLLVSSGLAWQGLLDAAVLLPPLDRAVTLLSLVLIIWVWAFPEPVRMADAAVVLLVLLVLTLAALGVVWWSALAGSISFNGSWADVIAEIAALILIGVGILILLARQPNGWEYGFGMLSLVVAGHLMHLFFPQTEGDFSGVIRLTQMAAYPLLIFLPQRFPTAVYDRARTDQPSTPALAPEAVQFGTDSRMEQILLALAGESSLKEVCNAISSAITLALRADVCLLLAPPDEDGNINVYCSYDRMHKGEMADNITLNAKAVPILASALSSGRALRLPASSTSPDLNGLAQALGLNRTGHLMAVPLAPAQSPPAVGVVLITPQSNRGWTAEDQLALTNLAKPLLQVILRAQQFEEVQANLAQAQQLTEHTQSQFDQVSTEKENLARQLEILQRKTEQEHAQLESLAAMVSASDDAQTIISRLQAENESLKRDPGLASVLHPSDVEHFEGELRLALEEVALLRTALLEADQKILALKSTDPNLSGEQMEVIATIARELRQPMSAIVGYTDFLLGESVGILGSLQRKFLERVKISTERMSHLVDDLFKVAALESGQFQLATDSVDLSAVIDDAIANTSSQLREKNIALRVDMPDELPSLNADPDALQQILVNLLQNAGAVTPSGGNILLRAKIESSEGVQDYVLLQVADNGGGIAADDVPKVFSQHYNQDSTSIPGVSETGAGLTIIKTLVELLGGRIWVDSQLGYGSTFSILLQVSPSPQLLEEPEESV